MPNNKKDPLTPEEIQKENETLDSLAIAAFKDLVNSIQSEIKPYLNTEGEQVLGNEVSVNRASLIKINQALASRNETYETLLEVSHKQTEEIVKFKRDNKKVVKLTEENKQLKNGYEDLCIGYDNLKKLIHEISVRQGKHVEGCDKNFLRIEKVLKSGGF